MSLVFAFHVGRRLPWIILEATDGWWFVGGIEGGRVINWVYIWNHDTQLRNQCSCWLEASVEIWGWGYSNKYIFIIYDMTIYGLHFSYDSLPPEYHRLNRSTSIPIHSSGLYLLFMTWPYMVNWYIHWLTERMSEWLNRCVYFFLFHSSVLYLLLMSWPFLSFYWYIRWLTEPMSEWFNRSIFFILSFFLIVSVAYILVYLICLIVLGIPLFFLEIMIGQFASLGPLTIWKINLMFKGRTPLFKRNGLLFRSHSLKERS